MVLTKIFSILLFLFHISLSAEIVHLCIHDEGPYKQLTTYKNVVVQRDGDSFGKIDALIDTYFSNYICNESNPTEKRTCAKEEGAPFFLNRDIEDFFKILYERFEKQVTDTTAEYNKEYEVYRKIFQENNSDPNNYEVKKQKGVLTQIKKKISLAKSRLKQFKLDIQDYFVKLGNIREFYNICKVQIKNVIEGSFRGCKTKYFKDVVYIDSIEKLNTEVYKMIDKELNNSFNFQRTSLESNQNPSGDSEKAKKFADSIVNTKGNKLSDYLFNSYLKIAKSYKKCDGEENFPTKNSERKSQRSRQ